MKEMNDEELQQWLQGNPPLSPGDILNKDAEAYRALFETLEQEPAGGLPYDFAARVTRHIKATEKRTNELKYNIVAFFIFLAVVAALAAFLAVFAPKQAPVLLKYKWVLILFPVVFIAIQYFDQKLIKTRIFRNDANS
jgi:hypothetical protein